ncbi:DUF5615 family PIN-like protein [bacterium]|nr:DUF5615 family PIN-like protein [bacterium]
MLCLADENLEFAFVNWLRKEGHDVLWAAESLKAFTDNDLLKIASHEKRIILTRDLDFGELAFRERVRTHGIVLLRIKAVNQYERLDIFQKSWSLISMDVSNNFIVVTNTKIRIRPLSI